MKIIQAKYWTERLELTRPYTIAYERIDAVENIFVRLQTEDGSIGLGVAAPDAEVTGESVVDCRQALAGGLEPLVLDRDIRQLNMILRQVENALSARPAARAAIDIALHDLWAKYLDLPLVEVLGRCHRSLPTSITIGIKSIAESLSEAEEYRARGFRIFKIKIGQSVEQDVACLRQIRERIGSKILLRVDANQGYAPADFNKFIDQTDSLDLEFVEQPLPAGDFANMRGLPESVRNSTAADECLLDARNALECLQPPRPFGIFNIKLMKCGGIAPGLQIAAIANLAGIDLMWGCMDESRVGIAAALHAALASPNTRYLDLDGSLDLARDLVQGGFILENGEMRVTDRPGLGVKMIADCGLRIAD
ncbi:L-alanine-DL-glutamate epimerase (EC [Olavius algarvensis Delta 1 endosymbiont]|nr:L-alanine-DL-glutamate epimerase (EC [Olavius algarvensis Delta 1 endosymbiont]